MNKNLPDFSNTNILVIGDLMLDKYIYGEANRISPESPVPIILAERTEDRLGGAANVAFNLVKIGCNVSLLGFAGIDDNSKILINEIERNSIDNLLIINKEYKTITKTRIVSKNQQLLRIDNEKKVPEMLLNSLNNRLKKIINKYDLIIISDYDKGCLEDVGNLIKICKSNNLPVIVDPKQSDFKKYYGANLITPNIKEFENMVGQSKNDMELEKNANLLIEKLQLDGILVTKGSGGVSFIDKNLKVIHQKAEVVDVYDVTGAGDTFIAIFSACLASCLEYEESLLFANTGAGIVVGKFGTSTVTNAEINKKINNKNSNLSKILTQENLLKTIKGFKESKKKIVFTNGCFDILHIGHAHYLSEAKKLGDILIVGVNTDSSVKANKGLNRPINNLDNRIALLSFLESIDFIIAFKEKTPEKIISLLMPDILVKGSDYKVSKIVGADIVLNNGGEVKTINFLDGHSSTKIITKIKDSIISR